MFELNLILFYVANGRAVECIFFLLFTFALHVLTLIETNLSEKQNLVENLKARVEQFQALIV